jgi:hypothetical protein
MPVWLEWLAHDLSQARMGMNDGRARRGNRQMMLAVTEGEEQHVARLDLAVRFDQTRRAGVVQPLAHIKVAEHVAERSVRPPANRL